jgi:hypothetical protein
MSSKKENAALIGVGVAACAVCCGGPILGFLAAIGLGTALGVALFGVVGLSIAALGAAVLVRRRHRSASCTQEAEQHVDVSPTRR